jgi:hypothetical protein
MLNLEQILTDLQVPRISKFNEECYRQNFDKDEFLDFPLLILQKYSENIDWIDIWFLIKFKTFKINTFLN